VPSLLAAVLRAVVHGEGRVLTTTNGCLFATGPIFGSVEQVFGRLPPASASS
jgi:hypothetical protein